MKRFKRQAVVLALLAVGIFLISENAQLKIMGILLLTLALIPLSVALWELGVFLMWGIEKSIFFHSIRSYANYSKTARHRKGHSRCG